MTSFYGSSCANNGKGALNTPEVPLFERGYEKDPAAVAQEAYRQAQRDKIDVLLIDTAGRMQVGPSEFAPVLLSAVAPARGRGVSVSHWSDQMRGWFVATCTILLMGFALLARVPRASRLRIFAAPQVRPSYTLSQHF
eukprot:3495612-Pyramimonas_sp.AAC.1